MKAILELPNITGAIGVAVIGGLFVLGVLFLVWTYVSSRH